MKKLLFPIFFLMLSITTMSQSFLYVHGIVTDLATQNPIPNQTVIIHNDSVPSGSYFYHTVVTDNLGFYTDTIPVVFSGTTGNLYVGTVDCQNYLQVLSFVYSPLQTSFVADFAICYLNNPCQAAFIHQQPQPLVVEFTDVSVGGGTERQWSFGDGTTSNLANPVHTYMQPGSYQVELTIGALGTPCYNTVSQTIYIWDSIGGGCQASFIVIPDSLNTLNTYHFFNQSTGNNINTWTWNFGDGFSYTVTLPGSPNVVHTYALPGTYTACLTIHGTDSTCFDTECLTLVVGTNPGCQAAFTYYADSLNSFTNVHFFDQSAGNIVSWNWNFGDPMSGLNNFSSQQNPTHLFSVPGTYNVCLTIHGSDSTCFDMTCQLVSVGSNTGCQSNFSYSTNPGSGNKTIYFNDLSSGNPTAWQWSFGDGTASYAQNPVHTYSSPGTYTVCLTISGNNCTDIFCQNVVIQDSVNYHQVYGQVFEGNFPLTLGLAMIFSIDTNANSQPFVAVCPIDSNGIYYFTLVPDGNYYIMAMPFDSNGYLPTYYGNTINWEQASLIMLGTPNNPYDINLVPSDQMTPGPGSTSGQINMGDVSSSMTEMINMILMNSLGQPIGYTRVSASGSFGFPSMAYGTYYLRPEMPGVTSDQVMITLTAEKPHAEVVMTFSGNKILGLRNEETLANRWSVYPNPIVDNLTISIDMKQQATAMAIVYDITGLQVAKADAHLNSGMNTIRVTTNHLPSGIYVIRISTPKGDILKTTLIKTKK